jgi:hypothetical protein
VTSALALALTASFCIQAAGQFDARPSFFLDERAAGGLAESEVDLADDDSEDAADDDDDAADDEEEDGVKIYLEEVFLGTVVYPQEQNELQLTWGYYHGVESDRDSLLFFETEYGLTDRLQIGFEVPVDFIREEERFDGMRNVGLELYYNFYNDRRRGRAYGVGFELGFPTDSTGDEPRAFIYEPFFVAFQDFGNFAVNFSAAVEIEEPVVEEDNETTGDLAVAIFRSAGRFTPILEAAVEISADNTPARLAPGLYWRSPKKGVDFAVSLPVGLNSDAPDIGVFVFAIWEFGLGE